VSQQKLPRPILAALGLPQSMGQPLQRDAFGQRAGIDHYRQLTSRQTGIQGIEVQHAEAPDSMKNKDNSSIASPPRLASAAAGVDTFTTSGRSPRAA
jgi:hypothetical protein